MLKNFEVEFSYAAFATMSVEADSKEEAEAWVKDNISSKSLRCNKWADIEIHGGEITIDHTKEV